MSKGAVVKVRYFMGVWYTYPYKLLLVSQLLQSFDYSKVIFIFHNMAHHRGDGGWCRKVEMLDSKSLRHTL